MVPNPSSGSHGPLCVLRWLKIWTAGAAAGERRASVLLLRRALPRRAEPATPTAPAPEALGSLSMVSDEWHGSPCSSAAAAMFQPKSKT